MDSKVSYDVVGIGNAIVDVLATVEDSFLERLDLEKGTMALIDADRAEEVSALLEAPLVTSGGATSNTMAGLGSFGASAAFIGKVADDELGQTFIDEMAAAGVEFLTKPLASSAPTAQSIVLVTPDAQRTFSTYLGASWALAPADVSSEAFAGSQILFLEGYMWDSPTAKAAVLKATEIANVNGCKVAISLADPLCVDRHRSEFSDFIAASADIVFANSSELTALYESDFDSAIRSLGNDVELGFVTRSAEGSIVVSGSELTGIPAHVVGEAIDTTGAGDQFAAGVLFGLSQGFDPERAARLGAFAGGEVVTHMGARPHINLADSVSETI